METTSAELCSCRRDKHIVAFYRTKICPTRNAGYWDADVEVVGYPSRAIRFRALRFRAVLSGEIHIRAAQFRAIRVSAASPQAKHRGCHLHFCQAIYRSVQRMGLVGAYESQPEIRLQVRQLMAFLPIAIVRLTFNNLEAQANPLLQPLFGTLQQRHQQAPPQDLEISGVPVGVS